MSARKGLRFVVPTGMDDPDRVSGGNVYDRRLADGLAARGWDIELVPVSTGDEVATALESGLSDVLLVDGLVAALRPSAVESAETLGSHVVVLAHMVSEAFPNPDGERVAQEREALGSADAVVATSTWTASELVSRGIVDRDRVTVALPGASDGPAALGDPGSLLCVGVLSSHKGQDLLLEALSHLTDLDWSCTIAGSRTADPDFARRVSAAASAFGPRVRMPGVLRRDQLDRVYQGAGLLIVPSRTEAFGMVIVDARRRGLPVLAAETGGIPEAAAGGGALLVPSGDAVALAEQLRAWLTDVTLRERLRSELSAASLELPEWSDTVPAVERVLAA